MITYKQCFLIFICFFNCSVAFASAQGSIEAAELTTIVRQLELIQSAVEQKAKQPINTHSRYHFNYQRLNTDLNKIKAGIHDYLAPMRAQPRVVEEISGDYKKEARNQ